MSHVIRTMGMDEPSGGAGANGINVGIAVRAGFGSAFGSRMIGRGICAGRTWR